MKADAITCNRFTRKRTANENSFTHRLCVMPHFTTNEAYARLQPILAVAAITAIGSSLTWEQWTPQEETTKMPRVVGFVGGTWYVVRGTWYVVRGTWYVVRGTWYGREWLWVQFLKALRKLTRHVNLMNTIIHALTPVSAAVGVSRLRNAPDLNLEHLQSICGDL